MRKTRIRKTAMFLLTFVIVCCILPISTYAAFDKTADDAVAWVLGHTEGVGYEYDGATDRWMNGEYWIMSCQCVDLIRGYMDYISGTHTSGNGGKYTSNWLPDGYTRIKKYNGFVPEKGDILIWPGEIGHVAIVTAVNSATEIVYSDQNGASVNGVSYAKKVKHGRKMNPANNDYWGVIRPDFSKGPYTLDVNGWLDGKNKDNIYGYGTFDIYLGGTRMKKDEGDYWNQEVKTGTSYTIKNVKTADGKVFAGFKSGAYTGTVSQNTTVVMEFRTINSKEWVKKHSPVQSKTFGGHTYKYFSDKVTWIEAFNHCRQLGGHLVVIDSKEENTFVSGLIKETIWLGATDSLKEGTFLWVDGHMLSYSNWRANLPNNAKDNAEDGEDYVTMYGPDRQEFFGQWNDIYGYAQYGFVCELDKDDNLYKLDVNGKVDGQEMDNIQGIGTFDYSVQLKGDKNPTTVPNVPDYYHDKVTAGTTYKFYNIKAAEGYEYVGPKTVSGTVNGNTTIFLEFKKKQVQPSTIVLDVNGKVDGKEMDNIQGIGTFDFTVKINGKTETGKDKYDYYNEILPVGSTFEFYNIKAAAGYEYVGLKTISGTANSNKTIWLEFKKKAAPSFTFAVDQNKYEVGETYAQIGYFRVYSNIDLKSVKRVGCELFTSNGTYLAGDEEDAWQVEDYLRHYFHISGDAGETDIRYQLTPNTKYKVRAYVIYEGKKYYSDWQTFTTKPSPVTAAPSVSVTFTPWESKTGLTYIGETDASVGMVIDVTGGTCTETGMQLFDSNGSKLASAKNNGYTDHHIYFKINEEARYTLEPGTTYKYKFYAIVNEKTYWSQEGSFKTKSTVTPTPTATPTHTPTPNVPVTPEATITAKPVTPPPTVKPVTPTPTTKPDDPTRAPETTAPTTQEPRIRVRFAFDDRIGSEVSVYDREVDLDTEWDTALASVYTTEEELLLTPGTYWYAAWFNDDDWPDILVVQDSFTVTALSSSKQPLVVRVETPSVETETAIVTQPAQQPQAEVQGAYVIIEGLKNKLSVWKEANNQGGRHGYAYNGDVFELLAIEGEWYKIQYNGKVGYVTGEHVRVTNSAPYAADDQKTADAYVTIINVKNKLSVRKDASSDTKRLGYVYNDETYPLIAVKGEWYKIQYKSDVVGYVHEDYIRATNEYLVPHMENEWEAITPAPTKQPTPKPTPTEAVYVTEPPAAENTSEMPQTEPSASLIITETETEAPLVLAEETTVPTASPVTTDVSEKKPNGIVLSEDNPKKNSWLLFVLIGIGVTAVATLVCVATILIRRNRKASRRFQDDTDDFDEI